MHGSHSKRDDRRRIGWMLLFCIALVSGAVRAEGETAWTLDQLMQSLSAVEAHRARFVETRELTLLQQALTTHGTLSFQRPDRLVKQFDPPNGLRYEIEDNRLLIRESNGSEAIVRLDNAPRLLAYVAAMRAVLAGNLKQLKRYFELQLEGSRTEWRLLLTPREPALARQVKRVEIDGSNTSIDRYRILAQGGDRIITRLQESDAE